MIEAPKEDQVVSEKENVDNNTEDAEDELILKDEEYEEIDGIGNDESKADTDIDANIEDSLNLTIGEEEEQLLREDDDIKKGEYLFLSRYCFTSLTFRIFIK